MMPEDSDFNLDYRPSSYWDPEFYLDALGVDIKGKHRRKLTEDILRSGDLERLEEWMLQESLPDEDREALARIHPDLMGGEYLPDLEEGEVEVARIELKSTTGDVITLRAHAEGETIHYRIVDEYEGEITYSFEPQTSERPLSMRELIQLLDGIDVTNATFDGIIIDWIEWSWGTGYQENAYPEFGIESGPKDPDEYAQMVKVHSGYYPELRAYYQARTGEWAEQKKAEREEQ